MIIEKEWNIRYVLRPHVCYIADYIAYYLCELPHVKVYIFSNLFSILVNKRNQIDCTTSIAEKCKSMKIQTPHYRQFTQKIQFPLCIYLSHKNPRVISFLENRLTDSSPGCVPAKILPTCSSYESKKSIVTRGEH